jgi:hypothetical protein
MSTSDGESDRETLGAESLRPFGFVRADSSTQRGWASQSGLKLSIALMLLITTTDALLGPRVILIALLMLGPCCALLSARWKSTAFAGIVAIALAFLLALPDGIWDTVGQFALTGAVLIVAVACTWAAGVLEPLMRR